MNLATFALVMRDSLTYETFGGLPPFRICAATLTARAASTCGACVPVPYWTPALIDLMPTARQFDAGDDQAVLLRDADRTPACFAPWMIPMAMLSAMP